MGGGCSHSWSAQTNIGTIICCCCWVLVLAGCYDGVSFVLTFDQNKTKNRILYHLNTINLTYKNPDEESDDEGK